MAACGKLKRQNVVICKLPQNAVKSDYFEDPANLYMAAGGKLKRQNIVICELPM